MNLFRNLSSTFLQGNARVEIIKLVIKFPRKFNQKKFLVKNRNFGQKSKFWSKIEVLAKSRGFGQKSTVWSEIEVLAKSRGFGQ